MLRAWILALSPKTASSSGWVGAGIAAPYRTRRALLVSLAARHMRAPRRTPPGNRSSPPTAALRQVRPRPVPEQQSSASSPPFLSFSAAIRHGNSCSPPEAPGSRQPTGHLPVPCSIRAGRRRGRPGPRHRQPGHRLLAAGPPRTGRRALPAGARPVPADRRPHRRGQLAHQPRQGRISRRSGPWLMKHTSPRA